MATGVYDRFKTVNDRIADGKARLLKCRQITPDGCWLWTGYVNDKGYGQISYDSRPWRVHILSMFLFKPEEYIKNPNVNHKPECRNKTCFNPDHLYSGTQKENINDAVEAGNMGNRFKNVTVCVNGHEFTPENTYTNPKTGVRTCKRCRANR